MHDTLTVTCKLIVVLSPILPARSFQLCMSNVEKIREYGGIEAKNYAGDVNDYT